MIKIGDWVTQYSAGYWKVINMQMKIVVMMEGHGKKEIDLENRLSLKKDLHLK